MNINQWHTFESKENGSSVFPGRNAAKFSLWSLFDPGHTEGFGCTTGETNKYFFVGELKYFMW